MKKIAYILYVHLFMQDLEQIRKEIFHLAAQESYMGEEIPIRWIQFEHAMLEDAANDKFYATLDEVSLFKSTDRTHSIGASELSNLICFL